MIGSLAQIFGVSAWLTDLWKIAKETYYANKPTEVDRHLIMAGECFMFLRVIESAMRDILVLEDSSDELRSQYNDTMGTGKYPPVFARERLKLSRYNFGQIKNTFMEKWPQFKNNNDLHYALERIVIYRNGFSHAHVQPHIKYLLYTPNENNLKAMRTYCKCENCEKYYKDCGCEGVEPRTFTYPCLDNKFRRQFYRDIETVYQECILMAAKDLGIEFRIRIGFRDFGEN